MSKIRYLAPLAGIALLVVLIRGAHPHKLLQNAAALGWGLALIIALGGLSHLVRTWAWRATLAGEQHQISFLRMFGLRVAGEAAGQLGFIGQVFGDGMRMSLLDQRIPAAASISSVTLDRGLFIIAGAVVSAVGVGAAALTLQLPHSIRLYCGLFFVAASGLLFLLTLAIRNRWPLFSSSARVMGRVPYFAASIDKASSLIHTVETRLLDFHRDFPRAFWVAMVLNLACHVMAVLEVYLILLLLGCNVAFFGAFFIEALTKLVNVVGALNPGNIGTYEGGNILIARLFGIGSGIGLTLAITRRLRSLFWAVVGAAFFIGFSKLPKRGNAGESASNPMETTVPTAHAFADCSTTAVILANEPTRTSKFSYSARVGTLPILLRNILGARKAGISRVAVLLDHLDGAAVQRELIKTRRVPESVEWIFTNADTPLSRPLKGVASRVPAGRLMLIEGTRTYHPRLFRQANEASREVPALALTTGQDLAGICVLRSELVLNASNLHESEVGNVEELLASVRESSFVCRVPVEPDLWQSVMTREDCIDAERKLDRWLVKPTDGLFAQMNRKVSIPISRQIIKYPITPNMVSLFVLGVSFAAGVFFARGGYLNTVAGAILSVAASILDGCDGEVARLKLQDSAFGCWLETICDYLYYLFTFAGLTVGLTRSSGSQIWIAWGGLLVFGAIMSFATTAFSRHRLANQRPEELLTIWQSEAGSRRSNPLLFIGRHTEFVIRRCFMPYGLLAFAVLNLTKFVFVLCAVGANVVWIMALYSCCIFALTRKPGAAVSPAVSS